MSRLIIVDKREFPEAQGDVEYHGDPRVLYHVSPLNIESRQITLFGHDTVFRNQVQQVFASIMSSWNFEVKYGEMIANNIIRNILPILRSFSMPVAPCPTCVIVSSGRSLQNDFSLLQDIQKKAFIMAVDSAVNPLMMHDIIPDMFVTIDAKKSLKHFVIASKIPCAFTPESIYVSQKGYFFNHSCRYIEELLGAAGVKAPDVKSGGSVSTVAYDIARQMGFKRIILVGQDLALTDGKMYTGNRANQDNKIVEAEGMQTTKEFLFYRDWFERNIDSSIETINASNGLKIKKCKLMNLQEAYELIKTEKRRKKNEELPLIPLERQGAIIKKLKADIKKLNVWKNNIINQLIKVASAKLKREAYERLFVTIAEDTVMYLPLEISKKSMEQYLKGLQDEMDDSVAVQRYECYLQEVAVNVNQVSRMLLDVVNQYKEYSLQRLDTDRKESQ
ncbi:MAG: DUF115 domain-containing protein [bacterium]|nr:DUF115 domain-containing protein [bacterium]